MTIVQKQNLLAGMLAAALGLIVTPSSAQEVTNTLETAKSSESQEPPPYRPWTIGIGIGTDAIFGGGVSWRFSDHLGTRVGFGYSQYTFADAEIAGLKYDAKVRLMCEPLTL